jgi:hypothetical protein
VCIRVYIFNLLGKLGPWANVIQNSVSEQWRNNLLDWDGRSCLFFTAVVPEYPVVAEQRVWLGSGNLSFASPTSLATPNCAWVSTCDNLSDGDSRSFATPSLYWVSRCVGTCPQSFRYFKLCLSVHLGEFSSSKIRRSWCGVEKILTQPENTHVTLVATKEFRADPK